MRKIALSLMFGMFLCATIAVAQNSYSQTNLSSDLKGVAANTDPQLINPWGIAFFPGAPFWVADNNSGFSTLYDATGKKQSLIVTIPQPADMTGKGTPTGIVTNGTTGFLVGGSPAAFIFDSEDGTISGWNSGTKSVITVDNSDSSAVYKALAMITNTSGTFLLAANFHTGAIEVYDKTWKLTTLNGTFTDPTLPAGYAAFGVHLVGQAVYVAYAKQNPLKHDPVIGPGRGYVSQFDTQGKFVRRFASAGVLDAPWAVVMAPATGFGAFSGDLLIGNFGDGIINAFSPTTGKLLGQIQNPDGTVIHNPGLWEMVFGAGGTGNPNTLYFTSGILSEAHGLFGAIAKQ
jgi:uncharacterized protein (TIGR03118 family)